MKLKRLLSILIILSTIFLTGCWSSREINTLAITACIGIDKTENGYLVTEQVLNPRVMASRKATVESPVVIYTAEGNDLAEIAVSYTHLDVYKRQPTGTGKRRSRCFSCCWMRLFTIN